MFRSFVGVVAVWAVLGTPAQAQTGGPAVVTIEFLADGRCTVSAQGDGFRSKATYTPEGAQGRPDLRCAMPPVPAGRTVALTVTLPAGSARPGSSAPPLAWTRAGDRWQGTASLSEWPDAVAVSPDRRAWTFWAPMGGVAAVLLAVAARRRRLRRRTVPPRGA